MKPTLTLVRGARGSRFHVRSVRLGTPLCGAKLPTPHHVEHGIDKDVVRLGRYPVCASCRSLTLHDPIAALGADVGPQLTIL